MKKRSDKLVGGELYRLDVNGAEVREGRWIPRHRAERFAIEESMDWATFRGIKLRRMLHDHGLPDIGSSSGLLDRIGLHLIDKDMLDEPGELLCSAESTFENNGPGTTYFLDVRPRGIAQDFANLSNACTVADSLARSRLGLSKWDKLPPDMGIECEQASRKWVATFKRIAEFIGIRHSEIAAANLIFARSKRFRALKTRWEQLLDCRGAHQLIVNAIQPDLLWATGDNFDVEEDLWEPGRLEWRHSHDGCLRFGRGRIEFCGRWMDFAFTPSLQSWNAANHNYREIVRWTFPERGT